MCTGGYISGNFQIGPDNYSFGQVGWICPKCGRGNAPWLPYCDCGQVKLQTTTTIDIDDNLDEATTLSELYESTTREET